MVDDVAYHDNGPDLLARKAHWVLLAPISRNPGLSLDPLDYASLGDVLQYLQTTFLRPRGLHTISAKHRQVTSWDL